MSHPPKIGRDHAKPFCSLLPGERNQQYVDVQLKETLSDDENGLTRISQLVE